MGAARRGERERLDLPGAGLGWAVAHTRLSSWHSDSFAVEAVRMLNPHHDRQPRLRLVHVLNSCVVLLVSVASQQHDCFIRSPWEGATDDFAPIRDAPSCGLPRVKPTRERRRPEGASSSPLAGACV